MQPTIFKATFVGGLMLLLAGCATPSQAGGLLSRVHAFTDPPTGAQATAPAAAPGDVNAALQAVVQKANDEQQQAFSQSNPAIMKDTSTDSYYQQMVAINSDLTDSGVTTIKLLKLDWGPISVNGNQAQVTTTETWQTSYSDGSTDQETDRNVYTLVNPGGSWKVQDDAHPDSGIEQPASAQATPPSSGRQPAAGSQPAPFAPRGAGHSRNWSGYEVTGGNYTGVNGTWTVPQVSPSSAGADAAWVGIGGVQSRDLIQAGTEATATANGRVRYDAWVEMLPQVSHPVPLAVSPGDSVSVSINEQAAGQWLINFKNNTTGQAYQVGEQYQSSHSSAEWVEEAPSGGRQVLPLDNFGSVSFSNATAVKNGQAVNIAKAGGQAITMITNAGQPQATPSALGTDGQSFTVTRDVASSTPGSPTFRVVPGGRGRGRSGFGGIPGFTF